LPGVYAIVAAGGSGLRFAAALPKQFLGFRFGVPLRSVLALFSQMEEIAGVISVVPAGSACLYESAVHGLSDRDKLLRPVLGGRCRQESVYRALRAIEPYAPDYVLIHDAARPLVTRETVLEVLRALVEGSDAVVPVTSPVDSVRNIRTGKALVREDLRLVQTPEGFKYSLISRLHEKYRGGEASDDAALCDLEGIEVRTVQGAARNRKITVPADLDFVESHYRVGFGFDSHGFALGGSASLRLMGIDIPECGRLRGHSDADAGLHSLIDAILGALAEGSIGEHFPDTDALYKDADSSVLLRRTRDLMEQSGYGIVNLDCVIVCERPRITKYGKLMTERVSELLGLQGGVVSIKGKTLEGCRPQFSGGGCDGIMAYSCVLLQRL
jgi:2-C-methyl-D-erythritol 4-phosphate cytidylyltransferase/2-C-methyl-D-erythritol 2,4-cyclodiphosphate synthase